MGEPVRHAKDRLVSEHEIVALPRMGTEPAATMLAVKGWLELQEKGYGDGRLPFHTDMQALMAISANGQDPIPVGIMVFTVDTVLSRLWIDLSFVSPEFRGRGVYTAMWEALVSIARQAGIATIESATATSNTTMRAVARKQHREEKAVWMVFKVNP
jgi:GNAT superfamily N-acetyltransferase